VTGAVAFKPGLYYRCLSPKTFLVSHVDDYPVAIPLSKGSYVYCESISYMKRPGDIGRRRYARLITCRDKVHHPRVALYLIVSKNNIGSGTWEELPEMMVLALADELPST
jgi:hypothetical protein